RGGRGLSGRAAARRDAARAHPPAVVADGALLDQGGGVRPAGLRLSARRRRIHARRAAACAAPAPPTPPARHPPPGRGCASRQEGGARPGGPEATLTVAWRATREAAPATGRAPERDRTLRNLLGTRVLSLSILVAHGESGMRFPVRCGGMVSALFSS